jgi:aspartate beta-hydroxylase
MVYDRAVTALRAVYDRRIDTPAVLDRARYFPGADPFLAAFPQLRRDALAQVPRLPVLPRFHDLMPQQAEISANDGRDWRMFIFKAYGVTVPEHLARSPTLARLLDEMPDVVSCVFSYLAPGKHIPRHRGPFRGILRFHLMLSMPLDEAGKPACELQIDGEPHLLREGDGLLWDDTYPHEVWNRSDEVRIALLLDVWRREMPADLALLSRTLYGLAKTVIALKGVSYSG